MWEVNTNNRIFKTKHHTKISVHRHGWHQSQSLCVINNKISVSNKGRILFIYLFKIQARALINNKIHSCRRIDYDDERPSPWYTRKVHTLLLQQEEQIDVASRRERSSGYHAMQLSHSQRSRQATIRDTEILRQHLKCSHCEGHLVDQRFYLHGFPGGHKLHGKNVKAKGKKSAAYNTQASTPQPSKRTSHRTGHVYSWLHTPHSCQFAQQTLPSETCWIVDGAATMGGA